MGTPAQASKSAPQLVCTQLSQAGVPPKGKQGLLQLVKPQEAVAPKQSPQAWDVP